MSGILSQIKSQAISQAQAMATQFLQQALSVPPAALPPLPPWMALGLEISAPSVPASTASGGSGGASGGAGTGGAGITGAGSSGGAAAGGAGGASGDAEAEAGMGAGDQSGSTPADTAGQDASGASGQPESAPPEPDPDDPWTCSGPEVEAETAPASLDDLITGGKTGEPNQSCWDRVQVETRPLYGLAEHSYVALYDDCERTTYSGRNRNFPWSGPLGVEPNYAADYSNQPDWAMVVPPPAGMSQQEWLDHVRAAGNRAVSNENTRDYSWHGGDYGATSGNCHVVTTEIIRDAGGKIPASAEPPLWSPGLNFPERSGVSDASAAAPPPVPSYRLPGDYYINPRTGQPVYY